MNIARYNTQYISLTAVDKKEPSLLMMNQVGIEKSSTQTESSTQFRSYQNQDNSNFDLTRSSRQPIQPPQKKQTNKQTTKQTTPPQKKTLDKNG